MALPSGRRFGYFRNNRFVGRIILTLKNDLVNKRIQEVKKEFYDWAGTQGLTLDDVVVTGRKRTTLNEINRLVDFKRGDNMLKIDVYDIKRKLETLPWVKTANVRRSFFSKRNQY